MTPRAKIIAELNDFLAARGVTINALRNPRRTQAAVELRWQCFAFLRERGWTTTQIGRFFGRHHTTIMHGLRRLSA